jgi:hypothetical protein
MRKYYFVLALWTGLSMVIFTACDDDDNPATSKGSVALHIHSYVGSNEIEQYGDTVLLANDRKIAVSTAQLYLTQFPVY